VKTWTQSLRVYLDRPVIVSLLLGFSGGLPLLLVFSTLSAWLKEAGVSLTVIGFFSWASTAYALKFLWSPVVDRVPLPLLTAWLGQRRAWLLFSQILVAAAMVGLGTTDPTQELWRTALFATLLAFASATQDIVIDAYRVETLREDQQGAGAANYVTGYRIAMLCAGAGALFLADGFGWAAAYAAMAVLMGIGMLTVLLSPEPDRAQAGESVERDRKVVDFLERTAHLPAALHRAAGRLFEAVVCPFTDFMSRPHWWVILLFIALYKYGEALLGVVANPFYLDIGFSKSEIAAVSKVFGFAMTIAGGIIGGVLVAKLGVMRALLYAGILQCVANLAFAWQAMMGHSVEALVITISIENLTAGMATTPFVAYLAGLCNVAYTATQFALLTSLMNFGRIVLASGGGWLADNMDWVSYFVLTTFAAVPGLMILVWLMRRYPVGETAEAAAPVPDS